MQTKPVQGRAKPDIPAYQISMANALRNQQEILRNYEVERARLEEKR
jgi:hypothetical protein